MDSGEVGPGEGKLRFKNLAGNLLFGFGFFSEGGHFIDRVLMTIVDRNGNGEADKARDFIGGIVLTKSSGDSDVSVAIGLGEAKI